MADNKRDVFHWNFDLKETDSDFTDIEYSPDSGRGDGDGEGIQPFIFVDGNYKSDSSAASFVDNYVKDNTPEDYRRREYNYRRDEDLIGDTLREEEKPSLLDKVSGFFENGQINWKPILIALGVLCLVILLLIILWPKKEEKKEWAQSTDTEILTLVESYFKAKNEGNAGSMKQLLIPEATVDSVALGLEAKIYESFNNIKVFSYPGLKKGEKCLFVTTDVKFTNIDSMVPKGYYLYTRPDSSGKLRLLTENEFTSLEAEKNTTYAYYKEAAKDDFVISTAAKITETTYQLYEVDPVLKEYAGYWKNNDFIYPTKSNEPSSSADNTTAPSSGSASESTTSVENTTENALPNGEVEVDFCAYVIEGGLRLRSTPEAGGPDNVLMQLPKGHYLWVVGELDGWYHVKDVRDDNGIGGSQTPSGREGYVSKDYISKLYTDVKSD